MYNQIDFAQVHQPYVVHFTRRNIFFFMLIQLSYLYMYTQVL